MKWEVAKNVLSTTMTFLAGLKKILVEPDNCAIYLLRKDTMLFCPIIIMAM